MPLGDGPEEEAEEREAERELEQREIDDATPLTEEEIAEKERLSEQGFGDWNRRDFQQYINGSAKYGRKNYEQIADEVDSKDADDIKAYAKVFWVRYTEIADYSKYLAIVDAGEEKTKKIEHQKKMLSKKMAQYRVPLQQLKINYSVSTTNKKVYTEEEDRFLLVLLDRFGIDSDNLYDRIRDEIRESPLFRFDWFFLSRTPIEISRRCTTLLTTVAREFEEASAPKGTNGTNGKGPKRDPEDEENDEDSVLGAPAKKKTKNGVKVCYNFTTNGAHLLRLHRTKLLTISSQVQVVKHHLQHLRLVHRVLCLQAQVLAHQHQRASQSLRARKSRRE